MSVRSSYLALLVPMALAFLALQPVAHASEDEDDLCPPGTVPVFGDWGLIGCVDPSQPSPSPPDEPDPPTAPPDGPAPPLLPPKPTCPGGLPPALIGGEWHCPPPTLPEEEEDEEEEEEQDDCAGIKAGIQAVYDVCKQRATTRALKCAIGKPLLEMVLCGRDKIRDDQLCEDDRANLLAALPSSCRGG